MGTFTESRSHPNGGFDAGGDALTEFLPANREPLKKNDVFPADLEDLDGVLLVVEQELTYP